MSSIKRAYEEMVEREDEILSLLELAKEARPKLYGIATENPKLNTCNDLFRDLTENENLKLLAAFHLSMNRTN